MSCIPFFRGDIKSRSDRGKQHTDAYRARRSPLLSVGPGLNLETPSPSLLLAQLKCDFSRLADSDDTARYGHLSLNANVRHSGRTGDTDDYDPSEVLAEARRLAVGAAKDAYEKK